MSNIRILILCALACFTIPNAHSFHTRILGGRDPERNEIKYLVAIQSLTALCGGGIIDDKFILTAAHCLKQDPKTNHLANPTRIYAVLNNTRDYNVEETIIIDVVRALVPKTIKLPYGDVAVLELAESLNLENHKDKLQKLELPEALSDDAGAYPTYDDLTVKFAGFGHSHLDEKLDSNGKPVLVTSTSGPMQVAQAQIVDLNTCRSKYYGDFLKESQMCVRLTEDENLVHHQGVCTGDSGSPVVLKNKIVVGVASFVTDSLCNTNTRPAVFTRISTYVDFIKNAINGDTSDMIIIPS